jgi:shikimate kinase
MTDDRPATTDRTLWLVGMMGSGKSTVGRLVADELGRGFVDLDRTLEEIAGESVAEMVRRDERAFRGREADMLAEVAGRPLVVATGGGVVLDDDSVATMRSTGLVVWLEAPAGELAGRVGSVEERPLLGDDPRGALHRLLAEREWRYRSAAHAVVDATPEPVAVAAAVLGAWAGT